MTREQQTDEARRLRADGLSYAKIGERLGVSGSTVNRWLNPSKADKYRKNRRERYANDPEYAEAQRQMLSKWKREKYATDPEFREKEKRRSTQGNLKRYASNPKTRLRRLLGGSRDRAKKHGYEP